MIARLLLLALVAWDLIARARRAAHAPRQRPSEREPETITELVGDAVPAPPGDPPPPADLRRLGYVLVVPDLGVVLWVGSNIARAGRDSLGTPMMGLSRGAIPEGQIPLVLPSEDAARALLWAMRGTIPTTAEVLPFVATGEP